MKCSLIPPQSWVGEWQRCIFISKIRIWKKGFRTEKSLHPLRCGFWNERTKVALRTYWQSFPFLKCSSFFPAKFISHAYSRSLFEGDSCWPLSDTLLPGDLQMLNFPPPWMVEVSKWLLVWPLAKAKRNDFLLQNESISKVSLNNRNCHCDTRISEKGICIKYWQKITTPYFFSNSMRPERKKCFEEIKRFYLS